MAGKIYGIGVGPGDPELLTLKAARLIREADVVIIPGKTRETCTAYRIAAGAVPEIGEKEVLLVEFPMTKEEAVLRASHEAAFRAVSRVLEEGKNAVFLTLGDVTVYSTYMYLHERLVSEGFEAALISGVPSFCAAAARLDLSLGEKAEAIHILPGSYGVTEGLSLPGTKILMKSGRSMKAVKEAILASGQEARMVENCGMDGERTYVRAEEIPEDAGYFSLVIVKEKKE